MTSSSKSNIPEGYDFPLCLFFEEDDGTEFIGVVAKNAKEVRRVVREGLSNNGFEISEEGLDAFARAFDQHSSPHPEISGYLVLITDADNLMLYATPKLISTMDKPESFLN